MRKIEITADFNEQFELEGQLSHLIFFKFHQITLVIIVHNSYRDLYHSVVCGEPP